MSEFEEQPEIPEVEIPRPVTMAVNEPERSELLALGAALAEWHAGAAPAASALHSGLDAAARVAGQLRLGGTEGGLGLDGEAALTTMPSGMASLMIGVDRYKLQFWLDAVGQFCSGTWSDELAQTAMPYTVSAGAGFWQLCDLARGASAAVTLDGPLPNWTTAPQQGEGEADTGGWGMGAAFGAGALLLGVAAAGAAALLRKKKEAPPPVPLPPKPVPPAFVIAVRNGSQIVLTGRTRIGSAADNEICISGAGVAPLHAYIEPQGDYCALWDNASGGGTTVNGYSISQAVMVRPGDVILCGTVELVLTAGSR